MWEVVETIKNLKPWCFSPYVSLSNTVIELPPGTIEKNQVEIGDKLITR